MIFKAVYSLLFFSLAFACSKKKDSSNEAQFSVADLVGTWKVTCTPSQFGQLSAYRNASIKIEAGGDFYYESTHYSDDKCTITAKHYEESSTGSFQLGDSVDATAKRVTITATGGLGTPRSDVFVAMANTLSICGKKNWVKDASADLMDTGCIGWSEVGSTDGINLIETSEGKKQIQVFRLSAGGDKERAAGDDFTKD